jgi:hypothetical protein
MRLHYYQRHRLPEALEKELDLAWHPNVDSSRSLMLVNSHYLRKLFSTVLLRIKGGVPLPGVDAWCLCSFRARLALDGVSWAQGG